MKMVQPECPICGSRNYLSDEGFLPGDADVLQIPVIHQMFHPPWLHWSCFYSWPAKDDYGAEVFRRTVQVRRRSRSCALLHVNDFVAVFVSVRPPLHFSVANAQTGREVSLSIGQWESHYVPHRTLPTDLHENEVAFIYAALQSVWSQFPSSEAVLAAIDWSGTERHLYSE